MHAGQVSAQDYRGLRMKRVRSVGFFVLFWQCIINTISFGGETSSLKELGCRQLEFLGSLKEALELSKMNYMNGGCNRLCHFTELPLSCIERVNEMITLNVSHL